MKLVKLGINGTFRFTNIKKGIYQMLNICYPPPTHPPPPNTHTHHAHKDNWELMFKLVPPFLEGREMIQGKSDGAIQENVNAKYTEPHSSTEAE